MRHGLATLVVVLVSLVWASAALAHASLVGTVPAQNSVVAAAPASVALTFNEPVSPLVLTLVAPNGASVPLADFRADGGIVTVALPPDLGQGSFVLSYRVVSEDGHPIGGSIIYSVGAPSAAGAAVAQAIDWPLRLAIWADKIALYCGLVLGIGGVFFYTWTARQPRAAMRLWPLLALGLVAAPLSVGLQGLDALDLAWSGLWQLKTWSTGLSTTLGPSAAIAFAALLLAAAAPRLRQDRLGKFAALVALGGIGLALASTGHASAAEPHLLTRPAVFLHAVTASYWIGSFIPLWALLRRRSPQSLPALQRFSAIIPFALLGLVASGIALALVQIGGAQAILTTDYGRIFALKIVLVLILVILAAINRWWLTRRVEQGEGRATRHLVGMLVVEMLLALAILGTVAAWRFTPPPRALTLAEAAAPTPLSLMAHADAAMVTIALSSDRAGPQSASVVLVGPDMSPLDAQALTLELSNPTAGIEPLAFPAEKQPDGTWTIPGLIVPSAGQWRLTFAIRISDFLLVRAQTTSNFAP